MDLGLMDRLLAVHWISRCYKAAFDRKVKSKNKVVGLFKFQQQLKLMKDGRRFGFMDFFDHDPVVIELNNRVKAGLTWRAKAQSLLDDSSIDDLPTRGVAEEIGHVMEQARELKSTMLLSLPADMLSGLE